MGKFSIKDRLKSFTFAFNGIAILVKSEHNFWIHLSAIVVTTIAGFFFNLNSWEWVSIIFCVGIVLMAEGFNSSIEALANKVSPEKNALIKQTKDIAAGAVLMASIMAVIIACIIFIPKITALL
jgi:diacylglycerol kinase (ATP)